MDPRVIALLDFGKQIQPRDLFPVTIKEAAILIEENPFAFALAAVLDRGMPSEIIWTIPYHLQDKIGKLTPQVFADMPMEELSKLFASLPRRPRYLSAALRTVKHLSQIVVNEYDGDVTKIWQNRSSDYVESVFDQVYGVGPGIASMIVLLLEKCLGVDFTDGHVKMNVKPDVHVVRVFRRLGFIQVASPEAALLAARELNPRYPGALDAPAWLVGKKWCDPFQPKCTECTMNKVCPKVK